MRMIKRSVSILLSLIMVLSMLTVVSFSAAAEEAAAITTWAELQERVYNAANGDVITLTADLTAQSSDTCLTIPVSKSISLDLDGHTLDRGLGNASEPADGGQILLNRGHLTLYDSSGNNSGMLTGGYAEYGGAIINNGTLTVEGGTIFNNRSYRYAGAVLNNAGATLNVTGGVFKGNSDGVVSGAGGGGGAIVNYGTMNMSGGTITGNAAHPNGGGIWNGQSTAVLNLSGGTISGNYATGSGGGIYARADGTLNISGSPVIKDNVGSNLWLNGNSVINVTGSPGSSAKIDIGADNLPRAVTNGFSGSNTSAFTFAFGGTSSKLVNGEIFPNIPQTLTASTWDALQSAMNNGNNQDATITLTDNLNGSGKDRLLLDGSGKNITVELAGHTVDLNTGSSGNLKHVFEAKNGATLTIRDTLGTGGITGGKANNGGGIYVNENSTVKLYNVKVYGNTAEEDGGGIDVLGTLEMTGGSITGNTSGDNAGGIYCDDNNKVTIKLTAALISNNTAQNGGGGMNIHLKDNNSFLKNCVVKGNKSNNSDGGGISVSAANKTLTITDTIFESNTASAEGGGVYIDHGTVNITGGSISRNTGNDCGGIYLTDNDDMNLENVVIRGNTSKGEGGAGVNNKGTATLTGCVIIGNTAKEEGGGIFTNGTLTLTACSVTGNKAGTDGGGIYADSNTTITNCDISNNEAKKSGGAIRIDGSTTTVEASTMTGNLAKENGGAVYLNDGGKLNLTDVTVTGNTAYDAAGAIRIGGDSGNDLNLSGEIIIKDNSGDFGDNINLASDKKITIADELTGDTEIGVWLENSNRVFTNGFKSVMGANADPCDYFFADAGRSIWKDSSGEAKLMDSEWIVLKKEFESTASGGTVELQQDWTAESFDEHLIVDSGKSITLDLNGHTIDAQKKMSNSIIDVKGTLTVIDSVGGGKITGGNCNRGGAIFIFASGTFNLESGSITGNTASSEGGAIRSVGTVNISGGSVSNNSVTGTASGNNGGGIWSSGTLNITGGTISNNTAGYDGGGIYTTGITNISGGTISNNTARLSGGAVRIQGGTTEVSGGTFTGNTATTYHGGAIYLGDGTLNLFGGSVTGNTAGNEGGAILYGSNATLNVKGAPSVTGNTAPLGKNIYLRSTFVINVTGALNSNAVLDVAAQQTGRKLTNGLNGKGGLSNFTYNEVGESAALELKDNEIYIPAVVADIMVGSWDELQAAMKKSDNQGMTIALSQNLDGYGKDRLLLDGSDKNITIDLAGYSLNKNQSSKGDTKHVIEAKNGATLTVKDTLRTGLITGGWEDNGGGVYVNDDSTVNLQYVTVKGNKAGSDGGGIYVKGTLNMTGGAISDNTASDNGGGIFSENSATITLNGVRITDNTSTNDGGGLNIHVKDNTSSITGCTISGNVCKNESGGGLVFNRSEKTITLTNNTISNNTADDNGGGILVQSGTVRITGTDSRISDNHSRDGGGIFSDDKLSIEYVKINNNTAEKDGGGIYSKGTTTISGGEITSNTAYKSGGGMRIKGGTVTISGGEISLNYADEHGGGVYMNNDCTLNLTEGEIKENEANFEGGGIYVGTSITAFNAGGSPVVNENFASLGSDIILQGDKKINVTSEFDVDADLAVTLSSDALDVPFTHGFYSHNTKAPEWFFSNNDGYSVALKNGEAVMAPDTDDENSFIDRNNRIKPNVNSKNWMSGISGERRLNEINLPSTHDSGMKSVIKHRGSSWGSLVGGWDNAIAQRRYINEQLSEGVRFFDLRLNDEYEESTFFKNYIKDDCKNLWICHGEDSVGGTYWAKDQNGNRLSLNTVLTWVKDFLIKHPTETVILEFTTENQDKDEFPYIYSRLDGILKDLEDENNPSTDKPFIYMENEKLGRYTDYPRLKDCRGQILLKCDELNYGIVDYSMGGKYRTYSPEGNYKDGPNTKIRHVTQFYDAYGGVPLPTNATDTFDKFYKVGTNGAPTGLLGIPTETPLEIVDKVHPVFFTKGGTFDKKGEYFGWVVNDGAVPKVNQYIWKSNFFEGLEYCDINVKSGLENTELYPDKNYTLLRNTTFTLPQNIYGVDQQSLGKYFAGWRASTDNRVYQPGDSFTVTDNSVTFTAEWSSSVKTPVQIVWKDADNKDELRPDTLTFQINSTVNFSVTAEKEWIGIYTGAINTIVPSWDKISTSPNAQGQDMTGQYRYEVTGTQGDGYVFTMYHTPQTTVSVSGTVVWDDDNDANSQRPPSITLHLLADGTEVGSKTVSAADNWQYDFGQKPEYVNGEKVNYTVTEDAITDYMIEITDFTVTNSYKPESVFVTGLVTWLDGEDSSGKRPESVTVNLLADGTIIDSQTVSQNGYGNWAFEFDVSELNRSNPDVVFSVSENELPGYSWTLDTSEDFFNIKNEYTDFSYFTGHSLTLQGDIGVNFFVDLSPAETDNATISFEWDDNTLENVPVGYDESTGYYKASCPVAVAEMTCGITATLTINGEDVETNTYSVEKYAKVILTSESFKTNFISKSSQEKYDQLITLVKTMLDYGAKAQTVFDFNTDYLANKMLTEDEDDIIYYYVPESVIPGMITTEPSDMSYDLEQYGLEYVGSTIVYLSETSMRHYYTIKDEELFNAIKDEIYFDGVNVSYTEKGGMIYFEHKGIPARELNTAFILKIGENEYRYAVLDYVRACLQSTKVTYATKQLVAATYLYNEAAIAYFD